MNTKLTHILPQPSYRVTAISACRMARPPFLSSSSIRGPSTTWPVGRQESTIAAAVALMVIAFPLTSVLYQRGAFGADDAAATALALGIYGAGLPAFVMHKVLQPLYYAREDTRRPFRFAANSMLVNLVIAVGLMPLIGFAAAALATTLAGWTMAWQLWRGSRLMGDQARFDDRFRARAPRIILASVAMGLLLWVAAIAMGPLLGSAGWRYLGLALLVAAGVISYFAIGTLIGAFRLADFRSALRRQKN